jgi:hypothetical protein
MSLGLAASSDTQCQQQVHCTLRGCDSNSDMYSYVTGGTDDTDDFGDTYDVDDVDDVDYVVNTDELASIARTAQIAREVEQFDQLPAWEESALRDAELAHLASVAWTARVARDIEKFEQFGQFDQLPAWEERALCDAGLAQFSDSDHESDDDSHNYVLNEGDWSDCGSSIHSNDSDGSAYDEYLKQLAGPVKQVKQVKKVEQVEQVEQVYQADYDILVMCSNCDQSPVSDENCTCFFRTIPYHFELNEE